VQLVPKVNYFKAKNIITFAKADNKFIGLKLKKATCFDSPPPVSSCIIYTMAAQLNQLFISIIKRHINLEAWHWLQGKADNADNLLAFNSAFAAVSRHTGRQAICITPAEKQAIEAQRKNLQIASWSIDKLARVWLLMQIKNVDVEIYKSRIEALFPSAEMNELVALYAALPIFTFPEIWKLRCAEGIRSNIETVLQAIICQNPYPSEQLDELAWNQLVLKAFFTNQNIHLIIGLDERVNQKLADTLIDFAHERWAAGRKVPLQLWRCVGGFINASNFETIQKLSICSDLDQQKAAALACDASNYPLAKQLLTRFPALKTAIENKELGWGALQ